jgi:hypothetical protein
LPSHNSPTSSKPDEDEEDAFEELSSSSEEAERVFSTLVNPLIIRPLSRPPLSESSTADERSEEEDDGKLCSCHLLHQRCREMGPFYLTIRVILHFIRLVRIKTNTEIPKTTSAQISTGS